MEQVDTKAMLMVPLLSARARNKVDLIREELFDASVQLGQASVFGDEVTVKDIEDSAHACEEVADRVREVAEDSCSDLMEILSCMSLAELSKSEPLNMAVVSVKSIQADPKVSDGATWSMCVLDNMKQLDKLALSIYKNLYRSLPAGTPIQLPVHESGFIVSLQQLLNTLPANERGINYRLFITRKATFCTFAD